MSVFLAFLDDIYTTSSPDRVGAVHAILQEELYHHCGIRIHIGKTQVWNQGRVRPPVCDALELIAQREHPEARVWKGSNLSTGQQGIKVLGTPLRHPDFVSAHLDGKIQEHELLLSRIPAVPDLQSAWALLVHCASARATFLLRVVRPEMTHRFASAHDAQLWGCLCQLLDITTTRCDVGSRDTATLPLAMGGNGVAKRHAHPIPSLLGQLGRQSVDDTRPAPRSGHPSLCTFAESRPFSLFGRCC